MAASIHDILAELRSIAYDERDKGDRFERLMRAYLLTEPQYAHLYDEVWMWTEYPQRGACRDTGIDLLARIVTVSIETVKIVKSLPPLELIQ
jgi:predicted helicase